MILPAFQCRWLLRIVPLMAVSCALLPAAEPAPAAAAVSPATAMRSVAGVWNSKLGSVTLQHAPPTGVAPVAVTGFHDESRNHRAELRDGAFDPATGTLVFTYFQPWRNVTGTGRFVLSADGQKLTGTYTQPGATGPWNLERAAPPATVAAVPPVAVPATAATSAERPGLQTAIALAGSLLGLGSASSPAAAPPPTAAPSLPSTAGSSQAASVAQDMERGQRLAAAGDHRGAVEAFSRVIAANPQHAEAYRERARAHSRLQDFRASLADAERATALNPRDAVAFNLRGIARSRLGDTAGALADYTQAASLDPNYAAPLVNRAALRLAANDAAGARQDYDRALVLAPRDENALWGRGNVKIRMGDAAGAVADYDQALTVNSKNAGILSNRGQALYQLGRHPEAKASLDQALALDPKHVNALTHRGLVKAKLGDLTGAESDLQAALALSPRHAQARSALAEVQKQRQAATAAAAPAAAPGSTSRPAGTAAPPSVSSTTPRPGATTPAPPAATPARPAATAPVAKATPAPTPAAKATPPPPPPLSAAWPLVETPDPSIPVGSGAFKLVSSEFPKRSYADETFNYSSQGTDVTLRSTSVFGFSGEIRWSVPSVLIPGVPAKFRLAVLPGDGCVMFGTIRFAPKGIGRYDLGIVAGVRYFRPRREDHPPTASSDEFELVLPDISRAPAEVAAGRAPTYKMRWRDGNEMREIAESGETTGRSPKVPSQLPLVEKAVDHRYWLSEESKYKEFRDVEIRVCDNPGYPFAIYTYRWVSGAAGLGDAVALEAQFDPATKNSVRADGRDTVVLKVRVKPRDDSATAAAAAARATDALTFASEGDGARWVDLSRTETRDGWKVVAVQASNPDPVRGPSTPPATLQIRARTTDAGRPLARLITVAVAPFPAIEATPDRIEFLRQSGQAATVALSVSNPGADPWEFRAEYAERDRPAARFQIKPTGPARATLELTEAKLPPLPNEAEETVTLRVFAEQRGAAPIERHVRIAIGQEGLYVVPIGRADDGAFHVAADGRGTTKTIDFRVMVWDEQAKRLVADSARAQQLEFAPDTSQPAESVHALEVAGLASTAQIAKGGVRPGNDPSGIYKFTAVREVPANTRLFPARLRVTARLPGERESSALLPLALEAVEIGPQSTQWQIEYERCQTIINKYVPARYWSQLNDILEKRKMALGPKGLFALRQQIWQIAVNLTLAEGGEGWARLEPWESRMTAVLEWTEWGSKVAFDALAGVVVGPVYGAGISRANEIMKSAIVAWKEGELPAQFDDWFWNQTIGTLHIGATMLSDPQVLIQHFKQRPALAWAVCVGYQFAYNYLYQNQDFTVAATNAAGYALNQALAGWLTVKIMQHPRFLGTMQVDVPPNETVLWSGTGGKMMAGRAGTMLNATEAGQWAQDSLAMQGLPWEKAKPIWAEISRRYAAQAKGTVTVYLESGLQPGKIFAETELGALLRNPAVTEIKVYVKEGGQWVAKSWFQPR